MNAPARGTDVLAEALDRALAAGVERWVATVGGDLSPYEWDASLRDLEHLSKGEDCCYDRPSTPAAYALWYHGRRTNQLAGLLREQWSTTDVRTLTDVGCGTGATLWAVAMLDQRRIAAGEAPRAPSMHLVDSSPFMLAMAQHLWEELATTPEFGQACAGIEVGFEQPTRWAAKAGRLADPVHLLVASYLFDHSDAQGAEILEREFARLVERASPDQVLLVGPLAKASILRRAAAAIEADGGWRGVPTQSPNSPLAGPMPATTAFRRGLYGSAGCGHPFANGEVVWVASEQVTVELLARTAPVSPPLIDPNPSLLLDASQERAVTRDAKVVFIKGAAGSGKSRVIAERLVRSLAGTPRRKGPFLVTCFNKLVIDQIARWVEEGIEASDLGGMYLVERSAEGVVAIRDAAGRWVADLMNWDRIIYRVFGVNGEVEDDTVAAIGSRLGTLGLPSRAYLDPSYLAEELRAVIYGQSAYEEVKYTDAELVPRAGRRRGLTASSRSQVWTILMGDGHPRTFDHRRIAAHRSVTRDGRAPGRRYREILVDEAQDFTDADLTLIASLLLPDGRVVLAGDDAQALHLGAASRWSRTKVLDPPHGRVALGNSYRLSARHVEAVEPVAEYIASLRPGSGHAVALPSSTQAGVVGTRPVVVRDHANVGHTLRSIIGWYGLWAVEGPQIVTFAECPRRLEGALGTLVPHGWVGSAESMRKIKGLERPIVVWFTDGLGGAHEALAEWAYTILTRSLACMVIVLADDTQAEVRDVIGRLRRDRLLFWDEAAEDRFDEWAGASG